MPRWHRIGGRVSEASYRQWDRWKTRHNVTYAALLEALGERFADEDWVPEDVVRRARQIDRDRGSRL